MPGTRDAWRMRKRDIYKRRTRVMKGIQTRLINKPCLVRQRESIVCTQKYPWKQTRNKVSCFVSNTVQNSFHYLHSSGRFHWLTAIHAQLKHFHNCSPNQHPWLPDASEKSNQRSQTGKQSSLWLFLLTTCCQPTASTPSSAVPSVPWRFLSISLSAL